ncbi:MAG: helix-turn-helix transcriptional regulator [Treponema sp.]|jgi:transcriptional regulator with XRE-family HTH domain|nr:helix-turn-helix transcriptional regulator [Treponema sp.]
MGRFGTKQSNISRLESGNYNPSLDLLIKIAQAMDKKSEVKIV